MLLPIGGDGWINHSGFFVENRLRVAVFPDWTINRLPDIELLSRTAPRSQCQFVLIYALHGDQRAPEIIAHAGLRNIRVRSLHVESILILIKIGCDESPEVDRIRTCDESSVVVVGIKH